MAKLTVKKVIEDLENNEETISEQNSESIQIVSFMLGESWYGLKTLDIKEIIKIGNITFVPSTPDYVHGIISHRGIIVPVIDLAKFIELKGNIQTEESRIIICEVTGIKGTLGLQVDIIADVLDISCDNIEPPVATLERTKAKYIDGETIVENNLIAFLNLKAITQELIERSKSG